MTSAVSPLAVFSGRVLACQVDAAIDATPKAAPPNLTMLHVFPPCAMLVTGIVGCMRRRRLRATYGIGGSALSDFVCHCCCHCCSLAKEAREIKAQQVRNVIISADGDDVDYEI